MSDIDPKLKAQIENSTFMGNRIGDMTRDELLGVIDWALRAIQAAHRSHLADLRVLVAGDPV